MLPDHHKPPREVMPGERNASGAEMVSRLQPIHPPAGAEDSARPVSVAEVHELLRLHEQRMRRLMREGVFL